jgi:hypothetical protein
MTKKQQAERNAVWAHIVATTGAAPAQKIYHTDDDSLQLYGVRAHGARLIFVDPYGKSREFYCSISMTGWGIVAKGKDRSPIAAYNALCAAPFFATTVGVAFGLKPMVAE